MPTAWFPPARCTVLLTAVGACAAAMVVGAAPAGAAITPVTTRLVAGSTPVTAPSGVVWSPDAAYAVGGEVTAAPKAVRGTSQPAVFGSVRTGASGYRIPVAGRTEVVTIGFVETQGGTKAGGRVFAVLAEGAVVVPHVDVAAAVGTMSAYRISVPVRVDDGYLDLGFVGTAGLPTLANLTVRSSGAPSPVRVGPPTPPAAVTPETYGARGDGVTDDTAALQQAFDAAPVGRPVTLTAGRVYAHRGVLHLRTAGLHVTGAGVLLATAEATSSVWIEADDVTLDGGVVLRTSPTTRRWDAWEQMGLRIVGHTGAVVRSVTVDGAAAAGVYVGNGATGFVLDRVTVQNSRADGIHMTGGANNGRVVSPTVVNSGDDGVAVVSYGQDGTPCHDITVSSPAVLGTSWGRGLSVVGGVRVTETDIDVRNTSAAGVYIASEGNPWFTAAPQQVVVDGGSVTGANTDTSVDHGAVLVMSGQKGVVPDGITVQRLSISQTRTSASRNLGVITYGDAPRDVVFSAIAILGGPRLAYQGNTPSSAYRLVGVTHDGVAVPSAG